MPRSAGGCWPRSVATGRPRAGVVPQLDQWPRVRQVTSFLAEMMWGVFKSKIIKSMGFNIPHWSKFGMTLI